ncbi:MAG TPA: LysR family transcriptional regulator [Candidatus Limnocylindrales bacterium]|nr:LysR family transcriptional regulator [Candidatus Limnocylindrales bacterium]
MKPASLRQLEIYDAVVRFGTVAKAAEALGVTGNTIYKGLKGYELATGTKSPAIGNQGGERAGLKKRNEAIRQTPERLEALEEKVEAQTKVIAQMASELQDLADGLRLFFQRQPVILTPARDALVPTHRRIADGGIGGRREARG